MVNKSPAAKTRRADKQKNATIITPTVEALSKLISSDSPLIKHGKNWKPHRPILPAKSEGGKKFSIQTDFQPSGDQPAAICSLLQGLKEKEQTQILLGVTGSGKTFTMAQVIAQSQRPALILAHNKTLAAQLYMEFKCFFPENAVEYFVSYYDYYQPEAYVARSDTYIEKESSINEQIDRMRHAATRALFERDDIIIVSSISCIFGIGSAESYTAMTFSLKANEHINQRQLLSRLVEQQYRRQDINFTRGSFRVRGDIIEIFPSHLEDRAWRISLFGDEIESLSEFDPLTGQLTAKLDSIKLYANSHYVTPRPTLQQAISLIKIELQERLAELIATNRLIEAQRLEQRTSLDIELLETTGSCPGIENYSRYLTGRLPGEPPPTLFEYLPSNAILFVDESHVSIPQIGGMYKGDFRRKATLAEYGFRLPSCIDNRPLRFEEWNMMRPQTIAVSATPGHWEFEQTHGVFVEQIIRPTGLTDPQIEVLPAKYQVDDLIDQLKSVIRKGYRALVTVLTKRMAEYLAEYLHEQNFNVRYMHADIHTLERIEIIQDLRLGVFDVLIGINLLREGLDIPECGLVAILDADKEGFLRSETSLIQMIGRAARNVDGKVVIYADRETASIKKALEETKRRREKQESYNKKHNIIPQTASKNNSNFSFPKVDYATSGKTGKSLPRLSPKLLEKKIKETGKKMYAAADEFNFEQAAEYRDELQKLQQMLLILSDDPKVIFYDNEEDIIISQKEKSKKRPTSPSRRTSKTGRPGR